MALGLERQEDSQRSARALAPAAPGTQRKRTRPQPAAAARKADFNLSGALASVAEKVAQMEGIKRGRSDMVRGALLDMFDTLRHMRGGQCGGAHHAACARVGS